MMMMMMMMLLHKVVCDARVSPSSFGGAFLAQTTNLLAIQAHVDVCVDGVVVVLGGNQRRPAHRAVRRVGGCIGRKPSSSVRRIVVAVAVAVQQAR